MLQVYRDAFLIAILPADRCYTNQHRILPLKCDLLSLDPSDDNVGGILRNHFIVVEHFEFFRRISAHVREQCLWSAVNPC